MYFYKMLFVPIRENTKKIIKMSKRLINLGNNEYIYNYFKFEPNTQLYWKHFNHAH